MALRQLATYTSDDGSSYTVLIPVWVYTFGTPAAGFSAYSSVHADLPRGMSMRYINLKDAATGRHRKLHMGSVSATLWTTLSTAVTLPNIDGTSTSFTSDGRVGEKTRGR